MRGIKLQKTTIGDPEDVNREQELMRQEDVRREKRKKYLKGKRQEDMAAPASSLYNLHTTRKHLFNEIHSSFENYSVMMNGFFSGRMFDLGDIPKVKNEPIILIGSGASLDDAWPDLKRWKGDIMVSTSQATTCLYHGIEPKYIMALDPDSNMEELAADTWEGRKTILIAHPGVNSDMFNQYTFKSVNDKFARRENGEFWKGRIALFRKLEPQTPFYANTQKVAFSRFETKGTWEAGGRVLNISALIKTEIPMMGCVLNCQLMAAGLLGYNPIYLVGADFGFYQDRERFKAWHYKREVDQQTQQVKKEGWVADEVRSIAGMGERPKFAEFMKTDSGITSAEIMMFYKRNFMNTVRLELLQVIVTTPSTLIEFPFCPIKIVVDQDGVMGGELKGISKGDIINVTEEYLARQITYLIHFKGAGVQFTEFTEGTGGIMTYLREGIERGVGNLDYNRTIREIQRLARYSKYMSEKDKKLILSWKEITPEEAKSLRENYMKANTGLPPAKLKIVEPEDVPSVGAMVADAKTPADKREMAVLKPKEKRKKETVKTINRDGPAPFGKSDIG